MRARNIKPGFYSSDQVADCSVWARLLFPGLWMLADREGRLEDKPRKIKAQIFPYDSVDVEPLLEELGKAGLIQRYVAGGQSCIWIPKFLAHQRPSKKEIQSVLPPAPDQIAPRQGQHPDQNETSPSLDTDKTESEHEPDCADIPFTLYPSPQTERSLLSESDAASPTEDHQGRDASVPERETVKAPSKPKFDLRLRDFEQWYAAYPKHEKPAQARKAWEKAVREGVLPPLEALLETLAWQKRKDQWQEYKYIPLPASYLNAHAWLDEKPKNSPPPRASPTTVCRPRRLTPEEETMERNQATMQRVLACMQAQRDGTEDA